MSNTAHVTWIDPTQRTDGTPLKPTEIASILVLWSSDNGNTYVEAGHAAAGQQQFDQALPAPGTYLFKLECVDTQSPPATSADSNVASVILPVTLPPNPPDTVLVQLI
jgi:hypothetical protein